VYVARPIFRIAKPTEPGHTPLWLPIDAAQQLLGNPGDRAMLTEFAQLL
jgi:8-oxo-dGTP diphosphatase